jgi:phosphoribosylanthranilate isomerase
LYLHYHGPSEELKEVLDTVRPAGITLSGGEEEAVGLKSFDAIEELFDVLEQELG